MSDLEKQIARLEAKNKVLQDALKQNYHIQQDMEEANRRLKELQRQVGEKNADIRREREYLRTILESTASAIIAFDDTLKIHAYNRSAEHLFRYTEAEILDEIDVEFLFDFCHFDKNRRTIRNLIDTGETTFHDENNEFEFRRKDGSSFIARVTFGISRETPRTYVASLEDITRDIEQKYMLMQQSRLAAMGEMIGNIAHQWRQPLNILALQIQDLRDAFEFGELNHDYLDESVATSMKVIEQMSDTIDDFKNFFKPNKSKTLFSLDNVMEDTLSLVDASLKSGNITLTYHSDHDAKIFGFKSEFSQVMINIIKNAKDVMEERLLAQGRIEVRSFLQEGDVIIEIEDNAGGIAPEVIGKVFDPYFTTKGDKNGTGIGLYMSKMIIEQNMKGSLTVQNRNEGACFTIVVGRDNVSTGEEV